MKPCYWCDWPTSLIAVIEPGHKAVRDGDIVWIEPRTVPRCRDCRRRQLANRGQDALARMVSERKISDCQQLDLGLLD